MTMLRMTVVVCLAALMAGLITAQDAKRTARPAPASSTELAGEANPPAQYPTEELEAVRTQLLNLESALEQLSGAAPANSVDLASLQQARAGIQQMPYEHLNALRKGLTPSGISTRLAGARQNMQAFVAARAGGHPTASRQLTPMASVPSTPPASFPAPASICDPTNLITAVKNFAVGGEELLFGAAGGTLSVTGSVSVNGSLGVCPACFSGTASTGITLTADIPSFPTASLGASVTTGTATAYNPQSLPNMRIPETVMLGADAVWFLADAVREFSQDACNQQILGENVKLACLAVDALWVVAKAVNAGIHYCDSDLTTQVTDDSYTGLSSIYTNLYSIGNTLDTHIGTADTEIQTRLGTTNTEIDTRLGTANTEIDSRIAALSAQLALLNTNTAAQINTLTQAIGSLVTCLKFPANCTLPGGPVHPSVAPAGQK